MFRFFAHFFPLFFFVASANCCVCHFAYLLWSFSLFFNFFRRLESNHNRYTKRKKLNASAELHLIFGGTLCGISELEWKQRNQYFLLLWVIPDKRNSTAWISTNFHEIMFSSYETIFLIFRRNKRKKQSV